MRPYDARGASGPDDLWVTLGLVVLGAALAVSALVWAAGQLAGGLLGAGRPGAGLADAPGVLAGLASDPADPAAAWPGADRALLPGPVAIWATLIALLLAAAVLAALALRLHARLGVGGGLRRSGQGAEWARPRQLRALLTRHPRPGRLVIGRMGRRLVAAEERASVIVLAPTGSFKTTGLAVPAILEWPGPVLALSVKRDLLDDTLAVRRRAGGQVLVYDPAGLTGVPEVSSWSPLAGCEDWRGAQRTAHALALARRPGGGRGGSEEAGYWYGQAEKLLAPMLLAARHAGLAIDELVAWVDRGEVDQVADLLHAIGVTGAADAWLASTTRDPRHLSSVYGTAEDILAPYADPGVQAAAAASAISPARLLDGRGSTLYLCAPVHEQERLRAVFVALVGEVVTEVYRRHQIGRPLALPLLLVLDEAANIAPLPDLARLASTGRAVGIQLVTVFQDLGQLEGVYGDQQAATVLNNHAAKLVLSGISCERTLRYTERLLGDEAHEERSITTPAHGGGRSESRSVRYRPLGRAEVVRQMPAGEGVLVYGRLPAARVAMRPWFRDRALRRLIGAAKGFGGAPASVEAIPAPAGAEPGAAP